ncbi:putative ribosomal protein S5/S7 [Helianthus annuus]|nr:putative ribosomal protein S5/S7 [Helianthus annuus]
MSCSSIGGHTMTFRVEVLGLELVSDLSVEDYITATASKHPIYMPHTAGRYQAKRFRKAQCPIVER